MSLELQRRHSAKCPHKDKGPYFTKCSCRIRIIGTWDEERVRESTGMRDWARASRKLAEKIEQLRSGALVIAKPAKSLTDAIAAFHVQHDKDSGEESQRKYKRVLRFLQEFCKSNGIEPVNAVTLELLDGYREFRGKTGWTWVKEVEILRQFFEFCCDRDWITKNPAKRLKRPKMLEANDVVPYTRAEVISILAACDQFGKYAYERLRARAIVLVLRHTGMRISDVMTLSREHIKGRYLEKQSIKNKRWIRIELPGHVLEALDRLPRPKNAPADCQAFFATGNAKLRSLVAGAERTLSAVFRRSGVEHAHAHRFRHTIASEILGEGGTIEDAANVLGDDPATVRRHYAKWIPAVQIRQDSVLRRVHAAQISAQPEDRSERC